jgi:hypothetical protein
MRCHPTPLPRHAGESRHPRLSLKVAIFHNKSKPAIQKTARKALLFLKKKKQKNFYLLRALATTAPTPAISKSFLLPQAGSLFFKKEALASP